MTPLGQTRLSALMELTQGLPDIVIGLIDGPVAIDHPAFRDRPIRTISGKREEGTPGPADSVSRIHGTFVAAMLCAQRDSVAPAISPDCTMVVREVFREASAGNE